MSRQSQSEWAVKVLAILKGGNVDAAVNQIKVAPSVRDLQQLRTALAAAKLPRMQHVDTVISEQLDALAAPRLHRSP